MNKEKQNTGIHKPEGFKDTPIGKLPADWEVARLDEIAVTLTETAGQNKYETVSISAGVGFVNQAEKFGKELSGKQYEKYIVLHKGDFSYNKGNSNRYPQGCIYRLNDRESAAVPNVFESFRIVKGCPEYYEQLFISGFLNHQLYKKINHGVRDDGLLNLTDKDFYSCLLPVPPQKEQETIAEMLSCFDRLRVRRQELLTQYKLMKKHLGNILIPQQNDRVPKTRFPDYSGNWERYDLGDLSDFITKGATPTTIGFDWTTEGIPFFRNDAIKDNQFVYGDFSYISEAAHETMKRSEIRKNDILVAITGDIGKVGIVPRSITKANINQHLARVRISREALPMFVYQYLAMEEQQRKYTKIKTGISMPQLSLEQIRKTEIRCPSMEEQSKIAATLYSIDCLINQHQRKLQEEKKLKIAMTQYLLLGRVRIKNENLYN